MKNFEDVIQAAINSMIHGHHQPHSYRAHVPHQGYVNDGTILSSRPDFLKQLEQSAKCEADNMGYASDYAIGQGYDKPKHGIVWANWNVFPTELSDILERMGFAVEWSDEWTTCDDCGKALRMQPTGYDWQPAYTTPDECTMLCRECAPD